MQDTSQSTTETMTGQESHSSVQEKAHKVQEYPQGDAEIDLSPFLPHLSVSLAKDDPHKTKADVLGSMLAQLFHIQPETLSNDNVSESYQQLVVETVEGGATNKLFKVSNIHQVFGVQNGCLHDEKKDESDPHNNNTKSHSSTSTVPSDVVLVRLFGAAGMIDRDVETKTFRALANADLAPPYYGAFGNGRLEGWMEGMLPLQPREIGQPEFMVKIAAAFARLHYGFEMPSALQQYHQEPSLWKQLGDWYKQALNNTYDVEFDRDRAGVLQLDQYQAELVWLRSSVIPPQASVSFCHNDLLPANILYHSETQEIQLIDFEYGGCNYRSFDIANHWNEYAGGPPDTAIPNYDWFPAEDQQLEFCQAYVEEVQTLVNQQGNESNHPNHHSLRTANELWEEVQGFVMVNHLYWGMWAVCQAGSEGCLEYDYMQYAKSRLEQYWVCKLKQVSADHSEHKTNT